MRARLKAIAEFLKDEDGPTAVEYAVMLAMITAVCIASVDSLAQATGDSFSTSSDAISSSN